MNENFILLGQPDSDGTPNQSHAIEIMNKKTGYEVGTDLQLYPKLYYLQILRKDKQNDKLCMFMAAELKVIKEPIVPYCHLYKWANKDEAITLCKHGEKIGEKIGENIYKTFEEMIEAIEAILSSVDWSICCELWAKYAFCK